MALTTCDRCGRPGAEPYPDLWLDLHPACADEWWACVERERAAALTIVRSAAVPDDDDPALLRSRGVL